MGGPPTQPNNGRRTTTGVFHIAEGGLPLQDDRLTELPADTLAEAYQSTLGRQVDWKT